MSVFTTRFWRETAERAVKSFGQGVVAFAGTGAVADSVSVSWPTALLGGATMAALSVATSLASIKVGEPETPSAVS